MKANVFKLVLIICMLPYLVACSGLQTRTTSSVMDYLYPSEAQKTVQPSVPVLPLPLNVGIAFVPDQTAGSTGHHFWAGRFGGEFLTEAEKSDLLDRVAENFRKYVFVDEVEVIPSAYLTPGGGFKNLDQIKTMYGIDVIALVSHDQVQFTDEDMLSLSYWTLIGAYVVSGEKNDTSTMLDTVVYDIESRKMLFRAPGTSQIKGRATPVNLSEELREDRIQGVQAAADEMIANLDVQLDKFKDKVKKQPEKIKVVHRSGYSGGGGFSAIGVVCLLLAALYVGRRQRFGRS